MPRKVKLPNTMMFRRRMFRRSKNLMLMYQILNRRYFDDELPTIIVGWSRQLRGRVYGLTATRKPRGQSTPIIMINSTLRKFHDFACLVLLHEMIHVKFIEKNGHGKYFKKERRRLAIAGAFDRFV